jgi:hypothetical protein
MIYTRLKKKDEIALITLINKTYFKNLPHSVKVIIV